MAEVDTSGLIGELDWEPTGRITYSPPADFNGQTTFAYGIQADGAPDCSGPAESQATVTLTVNPVNDRPTARADTFQALPDRTLNIPAPGVLSNDGDVDGDPLTAQKVTDPAHGTVTLDAAGAFNYTPTAGYRGPDGFSYRASDGSETSPVRVVSITVTTVPTVPPPTLAPTATPEPPSSATPAPSASVTPEVSTSPEESASASLAPSAGGSPSPVASLGPGRPSSAPGGLSIPVLVVGLLLASLLAFGGAMLLPKWLERRRAGIDAPYDDAGQLDDVDDLDDFDDRDGR